MSQAEPKDKVTPTAGTKSIAKKPYLKPEVRYERVFETMALSCGKVGYHAQGCRGTRKNS